MLHFSFDKPIAKLMKSRGCDGSVFQGSKLSYDLEQSLVSFKPEIGEDIKSRKLNVSKQINAVEKMLKNPYYAHPTVCINSYPTDLRAKVLAANIMESAFFEYIDSKESGRNKGMPLWVRLYGDNKYGYIKEIRDKKPGILIISNVTSDSTPQRLEMLRDILDAFEHIPTYVVQGGEDPIGFFSKRLYLSLTHAVRIGPDNRVHASPLDI